MALQHLLYLYYAISCYSYRVTLRVITSVRSLFASAGRPPRKSIWGKTGPDPGALIYVNHTMGDPWTPHVYYTYMIIMITMMIILLLLLYYYYTTTILLLCYYYTTTILLLYYYYTTTILLYYYYTTTILLLCYYYTTTILLLYY